MAVTTAQAGQDPDNVWFSSRRLAAAIGRQKLNPVPSDANELLLCSFDGYHNLISPNHVEPAPCG